jgi:hypothetical protein
MIRYHPVILHTIEDRPGSEQHALAAAARFEQLNGIKPQVVMRTDTGVNVNRYWYSAWIWDVVPKDVEYVLCMDSKVLPVRKLPELPELKFAASMDRHDRVNQGIAHSSVVQRTGKYFQMHVFLAHRDTQPVFEQLKALHDDPKFNTYDGKPSDLGFDSRGNFTPMNELIQSNFPVHELPRTWNWLIAYEKQYYFDAPYMINFNSNEAGTWAYLKYVRSLLEQIETLGGSLDSPAATKTP